MTFDEVMHTMSRDATTIARGTTRARMALNLGMTGRLVHHRGVEIIVTTHAFHYGRVRCHTKKEAAIVATGRAIISTTIAAIEDRKSDSNEQLVKTTAVTGATPRTISRLRGASISLDTA